MEKYNGYSNRSTWLAMVHLENTSLEIYQEAQKAAKKYQEAMKYWVELQERDPETYSFPFHQVKGAEDALLATLLKTQIRTEVDFGMVNINRVEVLQTLADNLETT